MINVKHDILVSGFSGNGCQNVINTFKLSASANVGNGSSLGTGDVKNTCFGITCPSITFASIKSCSTF